MGQRQRTTNVPPAPALALRLDRPPVSLDQVLHDGEPEAEPRMAPVRDALRLAEAIERERQELRRDALAGVGDDDAASCVVALEVHGDAPPSGVNLTPFASRFHTTCCSRAGSPTTRASSPSPRPPGVRACASAAGRTVSTASRTTSASCDRLGLEAQAAADDARHVEDVVDETRLGLARALQHVEPAGHLLGPDLPLPQERDPVHHRRQRRAQLVRHRRQELVLQAARLLRLGVEPRVVDRERRAVREVLGEREVVGPVAPAGLGGRERQRAERPAARP